MLHSQNLSALKQSRLVKLWFQVAGRTFGVPAQLAERIAVYTDNVTKQQQLDRQCQAYKQQRRLKGQGQALCTEHIDHVLLNKAAIVIPAVPAGGLQGECLLSQSYHNDTRQKNSHFKAISIQLFKAD